MVQGKPQNPILVCSVEETPDEKRIKERIRSFVRWIQCCFESRNFIHSFDCHDAASNVDLQNSVFCNVLKDDRDILINDLCNYLSWGTTLYLVGESSIVTKQKIEQIAMDFLVDLKNAYVALVWDPIQGQHQYKLEWFDLPFYLRLYFQKRIILKLDYTLFSTMSNDEFRPASSSFAQKNRYDLIPF